MVYNNNSTEFQRRPNSNKIVLYTDHSMTDDLLRHNSISISDFL